MKNKLSMRMLIFILKNEYRYIQFLMKNKISMTVNYLHNKKQILKRFL